MAIDLAKFGACTVTKVVDKSSVSVKSFWEGGTCVVALLRRFGCAFCRLECLELSRFKEAFDVKGVRLVGIGHDVDGVEEFQKGGFFKGELYLDKDKQTYAALNLGSVGMFSGMLSLAQRAGINLIKETREKKVEGNMKGDGWQTGGLLVIDKEGKVLYEFKQEKVTDRPDYAKIMEVFQLKEEDLTPLRTEKPKAECD